MQSPTAASSLWGAPSLVEREDASFELRVEWPDDAYDRSMRRGVTETVTVPAAAAQKLNERLPHCAATAVNIRVVCDSQLASDALADMVKRRLRGCYICAGADVRLESVFSKESRGRIHSGDMDADARSFADVRVEVTSTAPKAQIVQIRRSTQIKVTLATRTSRIRFVEAAEKEAGYDDEAGIEKPHPIPSVMESPTVKRLRELVVLPMLGPAPTEFALPRGVLITGPPGVGKSYSAEALAKPQREDSSCYPRVRFERIGCGDLASLGKGGAVLRINAVFKEALEFAEGVKRASCDEDCELADGTDREYAVAVLFFDDLEEIMDAPSKKKQTTNLLVQLLVRHCHRVNQQRSDQGHVLVVGATAKPQLLHKNLVECDTLEMTLDIKPPDLEDRLAMVRALDGRMPEELARSLAQRTTGYVHKDLTKLYTHARRLARVRGSFYEGTSPKAEESDVAGALEVVRGSVLSGYNVEVPTTRWTDIGGQAKAKLALQQAVQWPQQRKAAFATFGIRATRGVLLHGPPGCSKTLLARAAACESNCSFLALSGADVYSPYLGEAEATVRRSFDSAGAAAPAILFFDEIDALVCDRAAGGGGSANKVEARVLSTFLNCMDGVKGAKEGVVVIAATNRPHAIDAALLRPGRLETSVHVALPDANDRAEILAIHTKKSKLAEDVDLNYFASKTRGYSGAELRALVSEAGFVALRRLVPPPVPGAGFATPAHDIPEHLLQVETRDFESVLAQPRQNRNQGVRVEPPPQQKPYHFDAAKYEAHLGPPGGLGKALREARRDYANAHPGVFS